MTTLGIDIGGTSVKVARPDAGEHFATGRSGGYLTPEPGEITAAIREAVQRAGGAGDAIASVGVCVPGIHDPVSGTIVRSINLPALAGWSVVAGVRRALGRGADLPVRVVGDALATGWDVWHSESPRMRGRLLVLAIGTGIGAAVLDDGIPLRVTGETPGHFGQVDVSIAGEESVGRDGARGTLEAYVSGPAIAARHGADARESASRFGEVEAKALARGIRIAHAIYRPQHVRLAGGVGIRLGEHLSRMRPLVEEGLTSVAREGWTLACGTTDFHAARGAARLASGEHPQSAPRT